MLALAAAVVAGFRLESWTAANALISAVAAFATLAAVLAALLPHWRESDDERRKANALRARILSQLALMRMDCDKWPSFNWVMGPPASLDRAVAERPVDSHHAVSLRVPGQACRRETRAGQRAEAAATRVRGVPGREQQDRRTISSSFIRYCPRCSMAPPSHPPTITTRWPPTLCLLSAVVPRFDLVLSSAVWCQLSAN